MTSFAEKDVDVIGVSGDTVKAQEAFKKLHKLTFTLLADEKGDVAKAFGVPTTKGGTVKQKIDDKEEEFTRGVTIKRWTGLNLQPCATISEASQSSSSGCEGGSPLMPKSLGVATIPRPK